MHQPNGPGFRPVRRRRAARIRPYLFRAARRSVAEAPPTQAPPPLLSRVLRGLRALPEHRTPHTPPREERTPLVRLIDAQRARTAADRTPTAEIPVVTGEVSGR